MHPEYRTLVAFVRRVQRGVFSRHLLQAGVKVIGGCCGTSPEHLHAMVESIRSIVPRHAHFVAVTGVARGKALGGHGDAAQPIFVERPVGRLCRAAPLYLYEGEDFAAPDNQVNFAAGDASATGENPPAAQPQPPGGNILRLAPARLGQLPVQSPPPNSSARA